MSILELDAKKQKKLLKAIDKLEKVVEKEEKCLAEAEGAKKNNDKKAEKCEAKADAKTEHGIAHFEKLLVKFEENGDLSHDDVETIEELLGRFVGGVVI